MTSRLSWIPLLALLVSGCSSLYDGFEGRIVNRTEDPHSYHVAVTYTVGSDVRWTHHFNHTLAAGQSAFLGTIGQGEGGYTIVALIDNETRIEGQTSYQEDEGPARFTLWHDANPRITYKYSH